MDNKKNIDRLFQEKFKDFEVAPNDAVWERINESLPKKKKKRRVIPIWWQLGGVAAVIAILLTVGISIFNSDDNNTQEFPVVNTDETDNTSQKDNNSSNNKKQIELNTADDDSLKVVDSNLDSEETSNLNGTENNNLQKTNPSNQLINNNSNQKSNTGTSNSSKVAEKSKAVQKRNYLPTNTDKDSKIANQTKSSNSNLNTEDEVPLEKSDKSILTTETERKSAIKKTINENKTAVADNTSSKKHNTETSDTDINKKDNSETENSLIEDSEKESIENAIAENNETIDEEEKEDEQNRWSIVPNIAPVYFSSLGQGSALDQQFNENSKSSDVNMSYGISGSYAISKRLKIRAGVNRVNLNQTTADIYAFTGAETAARGVDAEFQNISFKDTEHHVSLMSSTVLNRSSTPEMFNTKFPGSMEQKFGFIEVPIGLEYALIDKKFGINVIGGFSTFILNDNEIYAEVNGTSTLIGEANNINDTSFSANFGLGMDYDLSKQWNINLEPTFKYQLNTFNNTTGDFRPFIIGVYTGLSFKF